MLRNARPAYEGWFSCHGLCYVSPFPPPVVEVALKPSISAPTSVANTNSASSSLDASPMEQVVGVVLRGVKQCGITATPDALVVAC